MGEFQFSIKYGNNETNLLKCTKVSEKPETEDNQTATFSGTESSFSVTGYTIEIEKILTETKAQYQELLAAMAVAESTGVTLVVMETKRIGDEVFIENNTYFDCKGTMEKEGSPTDNTTGKISLKASRKENKIQ